MFRATLLIPLFQLASVVATLLLLRRWRQHRTSAFRQTPVGATYAASPNPDLTLVTILGYLWSSGLLRFMHLFMPDLAWIFRIGGGLRTLGHRAHFIDR